MKKWKCKICDHMNSADQVVCKECGSLRQESSYDAIADEDD
jgi:hypothetical protein